MSMKARVETLQKMLASYMMCVQLGILSSELVHKLTM